MKRIQIRLDERTCEALRQRAYDQEKSMAAVARAILEGALGLGSSRKP
jgi:plasmid stability protein